jgi:GNAT superfamily N-acetyltransferase
MLHTEERLVLRRADALDAVALGELRIASLTELGALPRGADPAFIARTRRELWQLLREEQLAAWVLEVDGRVEGCACALFWQRLPYPNSSVHAEIAGVYVAPAYRRRGIAAELVSEAIAAARARGVRRIVLHSTATMQPFYRSLGFEESGQLRL